MKPKKHKRKMNYTVLILPDSLEGRVRKRNIRAGLLHFITGFLFLLVVVIVCGAIYLGMVITDAGERNLKQADQIAELKKENGELQAANDELNNKVSVLSTTVNQKVEAEEAQAAEQAQRQLPKAFPLTGSANIRERDGEQQTEEDEEQTDVSEAALRDITDPIVIFDAGGGNSVVATGDGTVLSVDTDVAFGHCVSIDHGNGYVSLYRNQGEALVKAGDQITRGAILYIVGEDNKVLGYQIKQQDTYIDPMTLLEING